MPSAIMVPSTAQSKDTITKFTNCRLIRGNDLIHQDLWISSQTGKIIRSQEAFYEQHIIPDTIIDLGGRILSPGFIDVQLNGAFGFDFSVIPQNGATEYAKRFRQVNRDIIKTGVTSYLPTLTSQKREVYHAALPHLGPSGSSRQAEDGTESLGAHCEGPFLNPTKNGIHKVSVMRTAIHGFDDLEDTYHADNINPREDSQGNTIPPRIKMITAAPELASMTSCIPTIVERGIVFSMGHTEANYEEASLAIAKGSTMITHLFNAMRPLHHRNPGPFGTLGKAESFQRPYFGVIADGIHLHPTSVKIAWNAHPDGFILVTDAMYLLGMPDGTYDWTNGERITKQGSRLVLEGGDGKIAGSSITLVECVSNFLNWSGASVPEAVKAVTSTPAAMLGLSGVKGCLDSGADADLVVLDDVIGDDGQRKLVVEQVWKFGERVF